MNWPGITPPLTSSRNSKPVPRGSGSTRRNTSPNWPAPPVCFLCRWWPSAAVLMVFAVGDARRMGLHFDPEALLQPFQQHPNVQVRKAAQHGLVEFGVVLHGDRRVLLGQLVQRGG